MLLVILALYNTLRKYVTESAFDETDGEGRRPRISLTQTCVAIQSTPYRVGIGSSAQNSFTCILCDGRLDCGGSRKTNHDQILRTGVFVSATVVNAVFEENPSQWSEFKKKKNAIRQGEKRGSGGKERPNINAGVATVRGISIYFIEPALNSGYSQGGVL